MSETALFDRMKNAMDAADERAVLAIFTHANTLRAEMIKTTQNMVALANSRTPVSAQMLSDFTVLTAEHNVYQRISQRMLECPLGSTRSQQKVAARLTPLEFLNEKPTGNEAYDKALAEVLKRVQSVNFGI